jgi:superfamily I DNA and RNA helicase
VLIASDLAELHFDQLEGFSLPSGSRWAFRQRANRSEVLIDTVRRFKGLEAGVVCLWGFDAMDAERNREIIYVGTSRAKSRLYLVGSDEACDGIECVT